MAARWIASLAEACFSDLVDAAVKGEPQFVLRRDGREVVVVSREYFEHIRAKPDAAVPVIGVAGEDSDAFDEALAEIRREGSPFLATGLGAEA